MAWMTGYGFSSRFLRMFVLSVTAFRGYLIPTIFFNQSDHLANFHPFDSSTNQSRKELGRLVSPS